MATREELWGSVTEPWSNLYSMDPKRNIMLWAWTTFASNRDRFLECMEDEVWSHAEVHRLTTAKEVDRFLSTAAVSGFGHG